MQVAETPHGRLRYQCSPYHRDSALYPFVQQFERAAGIAPQEPPEVKLDKLERVLGPATDRMNEVAPLIASMLSIPIGARYPALSLSPDQQRRLTLSALRDQMEGLAKKQPLLIVFEDAQWADATSLEVLDLLLKSVPRLPALLLITFRPEFEAPWTVSPDVAMVTLAVSIELRRRPSSSASQAAESSPPKCSRRSSSRPTGCRSLWKS